jgi:response regulator RpfG family c-di-GMP phosphodiesterase
VIDLFGNVATRRRCLVVDDEPRLRQVLRRVMEADGYACREAGHGEEAIARLEEEPAELVLSDLRMPAMDGLELLGVLAQRWPDTAVILVTAVADVDTAVGCLSKGAMDYLTKPFHIDEVRARVGQAMEKRRLRLENRGYQQHLEARVRAQARRIEEVFLAGVQALADALDAKDPYTRGHSVRVARYSTLVARAMRLDDAIVMQIDLGGHVHDIGKIGVREGVLLKPGRLTDEEYDHIMTHPVTGWRILAPLLRDAPVALNVVRSHHERFDGRGIPDGLAGDAIPLEARIAAVADSFDAMTSSRPYRTAPRTFDDAVAEIERCAGTQFDPEVVRGFLQAVQRGEITPTLLASEPPSTRVGTPPGGAPAVAVG